MRAAQVGFALLFLSIGCGGDDDSGGTPADGAPGNGADAAPGDDAGPDGGSDDMDASPGDYGLQRLVPSCLPGMRPALQVRLGSEPTGGPACSVDASAENIQIEVFTRDIVVPMTFTLGSTEAGASAFFCPGGAAPCREVETGSITFDAYEAEVGASGSWTLTIGDLERNGRFDAPWCRPEEPDLCAEK